MQCEMLLGYQSGADSGSQMLFEKFGDFGGVDILPTFQKSSCQNRYSICMGLDKVGHDIGKLDLLLHSCNSPLLVREEGRKRVHIIVINFRNVRVRHDNKRKISECLDPVG